MVSAATVISSTEVALLRDVMNVVRCFTTRFLRNTPRDVLQIDRSALWKYDWLTFSRYSARGLTVHTCRRTLSICWGVKRGSLMWKVGEVEVLDTRRHTNNIRDQIIL